MGLAADGSWSKQARDEGAFLARAGRGSSTWGGGPGGGRQGQGVAGSGQNIPCKLTQQPLAQTCLSATLRRGGREKGGPAQPPCLGPREGAHLAGAGSSHPWQGPRISSWGPSATAGCTVTHRPTSNSLAQLLLASPSSGEHWQPRGTVPPTWGSPSLSKRACHPSLDLGTQPRSPPPEMTRRWGRIPSLLQPCLVLSIQRDREGAPTNMASIPHSPMGWAEAAPLPEPPRLSGLGEGCSSETGGRCPGPSVLPPRPGSVAPRGAGQRRGMGGPCLV